MLAPVELTRDDEAEVLGIVEIALRRRLKQPPVRMVNSNDRLAKCVDLIDPPEPLETLDRSPQVGSDTIGLGLRIESKRPVYLVRILEVPLRQKVCRPVPVRQACQPGGPMATPTTSTVAIIITITTRRRTFMVASLDEGLFRRACRRQADTPFSITFRPRCS